MLGLTQTLRRLEFLLLHQKMEKKVSSFSFCHGKMLWPKVVPKTSLTLDPKCEFRPRSGVLSSPRHVPSPPSPVTLASLMLFWDVVPTFPLRWRCNLRHPSKSIQSKTMGKEKRKEEGGHKIPKCLPVLPCMNPWGSFSLVFSKELTSLHFLLIYIKPLVSLMCFYFYCLGPFTIILFVKA